jgi:hypothetical protein
MAELRSIRVRGECPRCGEVVETDAPRDSRGRSKVTWRGPCPAEGCEGRIIANRIPGQTDPGPLEDSTPAKGSTRARGQMTLADVQRIARWEDPPPPPATSSPSSSSSSIDHDVTPTPAPTDQEILGHADRPDARPDAGIRAAAATEAGAGDPDRAERGPAFDRPPDRGPAAAHDAGGRFTRAPWWRRRGRARADHREVIPGIY